MILMSAECFTLNIIDFSSNGGFLQNTLENFRDLVSNQRKETYFLQVLFSSKQYRIILTMPMACDHQCIWIVKMLLQLVFL